MAYNLAVGQIIKDSPHADGWMNTLSTGRFAIGRDWEATEARDDTPGFSPDVAGQYGWEYSNLFEYIERLACIAPIGTFTPADMSLSAWNTSPSGKWALSSRSAYLRYRALWFKDGRANLYASSTHGTAISAASYAPNLQFGIWRNAPAQGEAQTPVFCIHLLGDGVQQYAIHLPAQGGTGLLHEDMADRTGEQYAQAILYGKVQGDSTWAVIDTHGAGSAPTLASTTGEPTFQAVRIEHLQNALLIRFGDGEPWLVTGPWDRANNAGEVASITLASGPVELRWIGHAGCVAMYPLAYPASAMIAPRRWFIASRHFRQEPSYNIIAHGPAGTGITATEETRAIGGGNGSRPICTFTSAGNNRAQLFAVQEYRAATLSAGVSSPQYTQDNSNFVLLSMNGSIGADYKGSTFSAKIMAAPGYELATIAPNSKVKAVVNVHDGAAYTLYDYTDPVTATQYSTQFIGYAGPPAKEKPSGVHGNMEATLNGSDLVEARLRRKQMFHQCSFEGNDRGTGWTVGGVFTYILNAAGVPDSCIYVDPYIAGLQMPYSTVPGKRLFKFTPDASYAEALDTIVSAASVPSSVTAGKWIGCQWGVNPQGLTTDRAKVVQLTPSYEHAPGRCLLGGTVRTSVVDTGYTIDPYTTTAEDMIANLRHERSLDDFCNLLVVMQGQGVDAAAQVLYDEASWSNAAAASFVGDLWTHFEAYPDGTDTLGKATDLWDRIARWHSYIEWEQDDCPWVLPNDEVKLLPGALATGLEITSGSIYQIVSKSWSSVSGGRYSQTIQAVRVE